MAADSLTLHLFGPFEVRVHGAPLPRLRSRKGQWLLALLALQANHEVERAWLAALLWPDSPEPTALANLRCSLKDLRRALGPAAFRLHSPTVRTLALDLTGADIDLLAFDAALARGDPTALREAVALYRGPLLERCSEEWVVLERRSREEAVLGALERLATAALAEGNPEAAARWLRQAVGVDPLRETAQRSLMQALAAGGNYAAALLCYRELRQRLHRELNAAPDPETAALFEQLRVVGRRAARGGETSRSTSTRRSVGPDAAAGTGFERAPASGASVLPRPVSRFIGRTREMAELQALLGGARLLTLTGAGGCGKTRLALEVAAGAAAQFPDGLWRVELAALAEPALMPQAVGTAVGVPELPSRPLLESLIAHLEPRAALLLLDNCEHLLDACATLTESLLQACPRLQILATSREALGIAGEQCYPVPPLSVPGVQALGRPDFEEVASEHLSARTPERLNARDHRDAAAPPEQLLSYEAVQLFLDRAALSQPGFRLTGENAAAIAQICRAVDGLPLALELAAGRVKALPVAQIAAGLGKNLRLLTGGSRTARPRQQTVRASLDWSWALLREPERALLRRLSVFAGGWTLEAAEAVGAHDAVRPADVLDLLAALIEKSLVVYEGPGNLVPGPEGKKWSAGRHGMLEIVRQYARERLDESGEADQAERQHALYFLVLAERAEPELFGPQQSGWLDRLEMEHDNLRAAIDWTTAGGEIDIGLRLGAALGQFWHARGHYREGRDRLVRMLSLPGSAAAPALRAHALGAAGRMAIHQGDLTTARSLLEQCLLIGRRLGDEYGIARALSSLASVNSHAQEYDAARHLYEESLAIRRRLNNELEVAGVLNNIGLVAAFQKDYPAARELLTEALTRSRRLGHELNASYALNNLGIVLLRQGDSAAAASHFAESLRLKWKLGNRGGLPWGMVGLAEVAAVRGEVERAAKLYGAAAAARAAVHAVLPPYFAAVVAETHTALGEAAFTAAWAAGQAMPLEDAIALALDAGDAA